MVEIGPRDRTRAILVGAVLVLVGLIGTAAAVPDADRVTSGDEPLPKAAGTTPKGAPSAATPPAATAPTSPATPSAPPTAPSVPSAPAAPSTPSTPPDRRATLPYGAHKILGDDRFLVAYYGTARTGSLGVLGEDDPDRMVRRLERAARPFARKGSPVQVVLELIVTVADGSPGRDGSYSHDIARADVQRYIDAAHRHRALLLLDVQPGRSDFLTVARRWGWALEDPYVGLALDPEWRMGRHGVPGRRVGSVDAREVNRTSAWLRDLVDRHSLPQKMFVLHQFRTDMIDHVGAIEPRRGLVMVQHVDGFGTPGQKLDTFHAVARPQQFLLGFKLFYDEDVHRMRPGQVRQIRPRVRFVSFQ